MGLSSCKHRPGGDDQDDFVEGIVCKDSDIKDNEWVAVENRENKIMGLCSEGQKGIAYEMFPLSTYVVWREGQYYSVSSKQPKLNLNFAPKVSAVLERGGKQWHISVWIIKSVKIIEIVLS